MAFFELNPNAVAVVITFLEMVRRPERIEMPASPLRLEPLKDLSTDEYLRLFRRVGEPYLWSERLLTSKAELEQLLADPGLEVFAVVDGSGAEAGILEIDFRKEGEARIAFVGLVPQHTGQGHGRWLLAEALRLAWREGVRRVLVNTNSNDHPAALRTYLRQGFRPYGRAVGTLKDPRLQGLYPRDAAPHIPIIARPRRVT
jgi:GNAT superfamily N-acetyltransferase